MFAHFPDELRRWWRPFPRPTPAVPSKAPASIFSHRRACSNMETHKVIRTSLTEEFHMLGPCANWLLPLWCGCGASINISPLLQGRERATKFPGQRREADCAAAWSQCFLLTQKHSVHSWPRTQSLEWECLGKVPVLLHHSELLA